MNRKSLRKLLVGGLAAALSIGVATTPVHAADVTVKLWLPTQADTTVATIKKAAEAFEAANPGIKLDVSYRSVDEHKNALRTAAGTAAGPDLYFMWAGLGLGGEFVKAGVSQDLTKYYKQYGWADRFSKALLSHATQYGGYNGVPWTSRTEAVYYNKTLFKKAGIKAVPTTYTQLLDANNKLVRAGITPMSFGGTVNWHVMRLLDNLIENRCGATKAAALAARTASWKTTACVSSAFNDLKIWSTKYINKSVNSIDQTAATTLFTTGKSAMQLEGDWFTGSLTTAKLDLNNYGVFKFPSSSSRVYGFAEMIYMNTSSKNKDEAAKALDFLSSEAGQKILNPALGGFSVNKAVKIAKPTNIDDDWGNVFDASTGVFVNYDQAFPLETTTEYWRIMNLVVTGGLKSSEAGSTFQTFINSHK